MKRWTHNNDALGLTFVIKHEFPIYGEAEDGHGAFAFQPSAGNAGG